MKTNESYPGLDRILLQLRDPFVRDLAWVIGQPHLLELCAKTTNKIVGLRDIEKDLTMINFSPQKSLEFALTHLFELDQRPAHLVQALDRSAQIHKRVRLGIYYEHLVYYWLDEILNVDPIIREKQVFGVDNDGQKITLGALDIVAGFRGELCEKLSDQLNAHHKNQMVHLELASKFYLKVSLDLAHPPKDQLLPQDFYQFLGPNERDSLGGKLHRMYTHQLALSQRVETIHLLGTHNIQIDAHSLWLKGRLFEHLNDLNLEQRTHSLWLRRQEIHSFYQLFAQKDEALKAVLCEKPHWLAPPHYDLMETAEQMNSEQLLEYSQRGKGERGSTLWYIATLNLNRAAWVMIVPDDWGQRDVF